MEQYRFMSKELIQIQDEIKQLETIIASFPEGSLSCQKDRSSYRYFWKRKPSGKSVCTYTYLSARDTNLIERLAQKSYYLARLKDLQVREKALRYYMQAYPLAARDPDSNYRPHLDRLLENPGITKWLPDSMYLTPAELDAWANAPYTRNSYHPENLKYEVQNGLWVRSKSEHFIASVLLENHIPFRYECELILGTNHIYPDFTILHPRKRIIFIHEHFGMMDDPTYARTANDKIRDYTMNGYIPTINLLTTYETSKVPLDYSLVKAMIQYYFIDH